MAKNTNLDKELEAEMEGVDSDASEDEDDSGDDNDFLAEENPTALLTHFKQVKRRVSIQRPWPGLVNLSKVWLETPTTMPIMRSWSSC